METLLVFSQDSNEPLESSAIELFAIFLKKPCDKFVFFKTRKDGKIPHDHRNTYPAAHLGNKATKLAFHTFSIHTMRLEPPNLYRKPLMNAYGYDEPDSSRVFEAVCSMLNHLETEVSAN